MRHPSTSEQPSPPLSLEYQGEGRRSSPRRAIARESTTHPKRPRMPRVVSVRRRPAPASRPGSDAATLPDLRTRPPPMTHRRSSSSAALSFVLALALSPFAHAADAPRALPAGQKPQDGRLGPLRHLDNYFPFTPVAS